MIIYFSTMLSKRSIQQWRLCFLWPVMVILPGVVAAQQISYYPASDTPTFGASSAYEAVQDSLGYMWIGTDNGLYRCDGYQQFVAFQDSAIQHPEVYGLDRDAHGQLWFHNGVGQLIRFHQNKFHIHPDFGPNKIKVQRISQSEDGQLIYVATVDSWYEIQAKNSVHRKIAHSNQLNYIGICSKIAKGGIYALPQVEIQLTVDDYQYYSIDPPKTLLTSSQTIESAKFRMGNHRHGGDFIFLLHQDLLVPFNIKTRQYYSPQAFALDYRFGEVRNIERQEDGTYFISSRKGLHFFDPQNPDASLQHAQITPDKIVNYCYQDQEGAYWIMLDREGILYLPRATIQFFNEASISALQTTSEEQLIVGTSYGELFIFKDDQLIFSHQMKSQDFITSINLTKQYILAHGFKHHTTVLQAKAPWKVFGDVSSYGISFISSDQYLFGRKYSSLLSIPKERLLPSFDPQARNNSFPKNLFLKSEAKISDIPGIKSMFLDRFEKRIWVVDLERRLAFFRFSDDFQDTLEFVEHPFPYSINALAQDRDSTLWIATVQNGLVRYKNKQITGHWTTKEGLPSNIGQAILVDQRNQIWLGTNNGLARFNPQSEQVDVINKSEGLSHPFISCMAEVGDFLWVGTPKGLFRLPTQMEVHNQIAPACYITGLSIWDRDTSLQEHFDLSYEDNNLTIQFQALSYRSMNQHRYRYRMLGIDSSWVELGAGSNVVRFPQLAAGKYVFEVKAVNEDGVESTQPDRISFSVAQPFWRTLWFNAVLILSLSGIIIGSFTYIRRRREHLKHLNYQIEQLKIKSFLSQMNPHFIFNTLNSIQYHLYNEEKEMSMRYLSRFSDMIRGIFQLSQQLEISLEEELQFIRNYLSMEKMRLEEEVEVIIRIDPELDIKKISIPTLLIQPFLENAFKHGLLHKKEKGRVLFICKKNGEDLDITIEDNGIGLAAAQQISERNNYGQMHRQSSVSIIKDRIKLLNDRRKDGRKIKLEMIELTSSTHQTTGTRINITLPIK